MKCEFVSVDMHMSVNSGLLQESFHDLDGFTAKVATVTDSEVSYLCF